MQGGCRAFVLIFTILRKQGKYMNLLYVSRQHGTPEKTAAKKAAKRRVQNPAVVFGEQSPKTLDKKHIL